MFHLLVFIAALGAEILNESTGYISAGGYYAKLLQIEDNASIEAKVELLGAKKSKAYIWVIENKNFEEWRNTGSTKAIVFLSCESSCSFKFFLPKGDYWFVVDNRHFGVAQGATLKLYKYDQSGNRSEDYRSELIRKTPGFEICAGFAALLLAWRLRS